MRNPFEAIGPHRHPTAGTVYPITPATWPDRAIRRAVRYSKKLPSEWTAFFGMKPELSKFIRRAAA